MAGGVGVTVEQLTPDIEPQLAAPATDGTAISDATATPEPINKRLAHIMVALLPVGGFPPACPFTDHVNRLRRLPVGSILPGCRRPSQRIQTRSRPSITQRGYSTTDSAQMSRWGCLLRADARPGVGLTLRLGPRPASALFSSRDELAEGAAQAEGLDDHECGHDHQHHRDSPALAPSDHRGGHVPRGQEPGSLVEIDGKGHGVVGQRSIGIGGEGEFDEFGFGDAELQGLAVSAPSERSPSAGLPLWLHSGSHHRPPSGHLPAESLGETSPHYPPGSSSRRSVWAPSVVPARWASHLTTAVGRNRWSEEMDHQLEQDDHDPHRRPGRRRRGSVGPVIVPGRRRCRCPPRPARAPRRSRPGRTRSSPSRGGYRPG